MNIIPLSQLVQSNSPLMEKFIEGNNLIIVDENGNRYMIENYLAYNETTQMEVDEILDLLGDTGDLNDVSNNSEFHNANATTKPLNNETVDVETKPNSSSANFNLAYGALPLAALGLLANKSSSSTTFNSLESNNQVNSKEESKEVEENNNSSENVNNGSDNNNVNANSNESNNNSSESATDNNSNNNNNVSENNNNNGNATDNNGNVSSNGNENNNNSNGSGTGNNGNENGKVEEVKGVFSDTALVFENQATDNIINGKELISLDKFQIKSKLTGNFDKINKIYINNQEAAFSLVGDEILISLPEAIKNEILANANASGYNFIFNLSADISNNNINATTQPTTNIKATLDNAVANADIKDATITDGLLTASVVASENLTNITTEIYIVKGGVKTLLTQINGKDISYDLSKLNVGNYQIIIETIVFDEAANEFKISNDKISYEVKNTANNYNSGLDISFYNSNQIYFNNSDFPTQENAHNQAILSKLKGQNVDIVDIAISKETSKQGGFLKLVIDGKEIAILTIDKDQTDYQFILPDDVLLNNQIQTAKIIYENGDKLDSKYFAFKPATFEFASFENINFTNDFQDFINNDNSLKIHYTQRLANLIVNLDNSILNQINSRELSFFGKKNAYSNQAKGNAFKYLKLVNGEYVLDLTSAEKNLHKDLLLLKNAGITNIKASLDVFSLDQYGRDMPVGKKENFLNFDLTSIPAFESSIVYKNDSQFSFKFVDFADNTQTFDYQIEIFDKNNNSLSIYEQKDNYINFNDVYSYVDWSTLGDATNAKLTINIGKEVIEKDIIITQIPANNIIQTQEVNNDIIVKDFLQTFNSVDDGNGGYKTIYEDTDYDTTLMLDKALFTYTGTAEVRNLIINDINGDYYIDFIKQGNDYFIDKNSLETMKNLQNSHSSSMFVQFSDNSYYYLGEFKDNSSSNLLLPNNSTTSSITIDFDNLYLELEDNYLTKDEKPDNLTISSNVLGYDDFFYTQAEFSLEIFKNSSLFDKQTQTLKSMQESSDYAKFDINLKNYENATYEFKATLTQLDKLGNSHTQTTDKFFVLNNDVSASYNNLTPSTNSLNVFDNVDDFIDNYLNSNLHFDNNANYEELFTLNLALN